MSPHRSPRSVVQCYCCVLCEGINHAGVVMCCCCCWWWWWRWLDGWSVMEWWEKEDLSFVGEYLERCVASAPSASVQHLEYGRLHCNAYRYTLAIYSLSSLTYQFYLQVEDTQKSSSFCRKPYKKVFARDFSLRINRFSRKKNSWKKVKEQRTPLIPVTVERIEKSCSIRNSCRPTRYV